MIILLHSSKSMKAAPAGTNQYQAPLLLEQAKKIDTYLKTLTPAALQKAMKISGPLAKKTHVLIENWDSKPKNQTPAIDAFRGDIYSGLQAHTLSQKEREYANKTLYILSGFYGILHALDSIYPYRLEMAYKFSKKPFINMYDYWGDAIASCLPKNGPIINLAADEYSKTVIPYVENSRLISPKFMTLEPKSGKPKFVVVHAKIARGAFANWLIKSRHSNPSNLKMFKEIGYHYSSQLSTKEVPVFTCKEFKGKGLSVKLLS